MVTLVGCLSTQNRNPMACGHETQCQETSSVAPCTSGDTVWWRTPYRADNQKDNPWDAFVHPNPIDNGLNPWATDNLEQYGVDVLPSNPSPTPKVTTPARETAIRPEDCSQVY